MQIQEVKTKKQIKLFHQVVHQIYKDDRAWICPPENLIENIFSPLHNNFYQHGSCTRFILLDDNKCVIGRVAAFINELKAYKNPVPTGGMGFFECIRDEKAAFLLFDTCKNWLQAHGMQAMDGPINFGENDNYWGLLVEGFDRRPSFGMAYHPAYYREFFENYGFQNYFEQITNTLDLKTAFPERFWRIADRVIKNSDYEFEHFTFDKKEKFFLDFKEIYDDAWQKHEGFTPIELDTVENIFEELKSFFISEFIWMAYRCGEPIAFLVMVPDINQVFQHLNGKLNLWGKLRFLYFKSRKKTVDRSRVVVMGVKQQHQGRGLESALFAQLRVPILQQRPWYKEIELAWVGDFNPKMLAIQHAVGGKPASKHITYRKMFDEGMKVEKAQIIK